MVLVYFQFPKVDVIIKKIKQTKTSLIACEIHHFNILTNIYLLKVKNRNIRKRCKICSKLTIKTPERVF